MDDEKLSKQRSEMLTADSLGGGGYQLCDDDDVCLSIPPQGWLYNCPSSNDTQTISRRIICGVAWCRGPVL